MKRLIALMMCAVSLGAAAQIETWSLSFNGPSSYSIAQLAAGNYVLQVSGTFCGGSCSGGHTTDAAYLLQNETAWGGRSFTVNEYCPQGWEGAGNCQFLRPTPDIFSPEHIYFYYIFHSGGQFTVYGLADECCWGDNLGGLDFALIQIEGGCTDSTACNFNFDAELDDGSCHFLCQYCKEGTVWDEDIQGCIVANPADINFDGCVQLNDLLDLLSAYGDCGSEESAWQCGDPLEYQGYEYATVQIGEQCWFAENLRAENYENGDTLLTDFSDDEWMNLSIGAQSVYDNSSESLIDYGRLYNGYVVLDERGICPLAWHVPTDDEFIALEVELGMPLSEAASDGWRGTDEGGKLKSAPLNVPSWNGNNSSGFSATAGGVRFGTFFYQGTLGCFWTAGAVYSRELQGGNEEINRDPGNNLYDGFSIRCIKD